jgi:hypothetical protein
MKELVIIVTLILMYNLNIYSQSFTSNYYYLNEVYDRRDLQNKHIGNVYHDYLSPASPLVLQNGTIKFLKKNLETTMNNRRDPYFVNLSLKSFFFLERLEKSKIVYGQFDFSGSFFIKIGGDSINVFPFKYHIKYKRQIGEKEKLIELITSKTLELNQKMEKWFAVNYARNQKLGRHVVVRTSDYLPNDIDDDTLYFRQRKLTVEDFTIKNTKISKYAAAVFTSMGYNSSVEMSNDTIFLDFQLKVYQIKGMSWILEEAKTKFVVSHEQTHFNITQLIGEKFKERLSEEILPPQDFDSRLQFLYLEYYRQINKMQEKYDTETEHGINASMQAVWNQKIEDELLYYQNKNQDELNNNFLLQRK